jgi:hypothetical protein
MKIREIREIAKKKGVTGGKKMEKTELIRAIQKAEGNNPCFSTKPLDQCDQVNCLWREDCALSV